MTVFLLCQTTEKHYSNVQNIKLYLLVELI